jgi:hypothetical protein
MRTRQVDHSRSRLGRTPHDGRAGQSSFHWVALELTPAPEFERIAPKPPIGWRQLVGPLRTGPKPSHRPDASSSFLPRPAPRSADPNEAKPELMR